MTDSVRFDSSPRPHSLLGISAWLVVLLLAGGLYTYAGRARAAVATATELDYGEGTVLWQVRNLPDLPAAVHPLGTYPYILFNYTPVYHWATRLMALALPRPEAPDLVAAGRLVSIFSMLGICALAGLIVRRTTRGWASLPAACMGALLLLQLPNTDWSLLVRVDMIGIFFTYLGLYLFLRAEQQPWAHYAAFAAFTLALYSRQTLIAAPAACLLCLFAQNPRRAVRVVAAFAAAGLAILGVLAGLTHGEFVRHLFTYNVSPFHWRHGIWLALDLCRRSLFVILPAVSFAMGAIWRTATRRESFRGSGAASLFVVYLGISSVAALSIAKAGANVNYLLEPLFACCILTALFFGERLLAAQRQPRFAATGVTLALLAAALVALPLSRGGVAATGLAGCSPAAEATHAEMLRRVAGIRGEIYSEEMTLLTQSGRQVPGEPSSVTFLSQIHLWDETPLVERFRSRGFAAVIVNTSLGNPEHFSPLVRAAVEQRYELRERIGAYSLYLPRATPLPAHEQSRVSGRSLPRV